MSSSLSGELVVTSTTKKANNEITEVVIESPPSFGDLTPPTPTKSESLSRDSIADISALKARKSLKHARTWPEWVNQCHVTSISAFFVGAITISVFVSVLPFTNDTTWWSHGKPTKARTGFRTVVLLLHAVIDALIFGFPYLLWYKAFVQNRLAMLGLTQSSENTESFNIDELPMTRLSILNWDKPTAQKKFYYSYTIDTGSGKNVATFGVSISNILFALIILFRYQSLRPRNNHILGADANEEVHDESIYVNQGAAQVALFFGLATRIAASGVPTFTVKKYPNAHYLFTGMMFMLFGAYMITEVFWVDQGRYQVKVDGHSVVGLVFACMARRICCLCYWFSFVGIIMFGRFELNGISSLCELLALFFQEMYIFTYIISFRRFDSESPML